MPRWTQADYDAYIERRNATASPAGLCPPIQERSARKALDTRNARKAESGPRFEIVFTVYAVRVPDYDNPHCKIIQDLLVRSGILHADNWRVLQGRVVTAKADSKDAERTEIEIKKI